MNAGSSFLPHRILAPARAQTPAGLARDWRRNPRALDPRACATPTSEIPRRVARRRLRVGEGRAVDGRPRKLPGGVRLGAAQSLHVVADAGSEPTATSASSPSPYSEEPRRALVAAIEKPPHPARRPDAQPGRAENSTTPQPAVYRHQPRRQALETPEGRLLKNGATSGARDSASTSITEFAHRGRRDRATGDDFRCSRSPPTPPRRHARRVRVKKICAVHLRGARAVIYGHVGATTTPQPARFRRPHQPVGHTRAPDRDRGAARAVRDGPRAAQFRRPRRGAPGPSRRERRAGQPGRLRRAALQRFGDDL